MVFDKPQSPLSINGFPVTFSPTVLADGTRLWVPRGISRNDVGRCWRLYQVSEEQTLTLNVHDNQHGDCPHQSLIRSFEILKSFLEEGTSRFVVDKRARANGVDRDPLVDSGVTGVGIGRVSREGYKVVVVTTLVSVKSPDGQVRSTHYYAGAVSERIETGIASAQQQFEELVRKAIYVRRYYNQIRSEGRFPAKIPRYEDVPPEILEQTVAVPDHLDLVEIMDSFEATPWLPVVKTTGGDPVKLAVALQAHDLSQPHRNVYLNGFRLRFIERTVEGVTLYLPNELYRARGEWRTRIFHADGIEVDTVSDADTVGGWYDSLSEAWVYLISELRRLTAPAAENRRPAGNTILETGIRAVNLSGYGRKSRRDGVPRWRFTLGISQVEPSGREKRLVLASWRLATVTDEQIRNDLRRAAATSAYRRHLLENGASVKQAYLPRESVVPDEFWPEEPPCQIKADDLWYFAEQREGAKVA